MKISKPRKTRRCGAASPLILILRRREAPSRRTRPRVAPQLHQKNICCVGDDDQSIYGWRGAEVDNILRFDHDFPGAKIIRLERNYRSTAHILAAASHLIAHNEGRLGKTLRTEDVPGEKVQVTSCWDSEEEARSIGDEIEQLQRDDGTGQPHNLDEIAILVRASFQMREFEDRFVTLGLPYRVIGGPRFYERMEIRDALAYLRLVAQPADDLAFERIVNVPKRGLGDATLNMLHNHARKRRIPLMEATRAIVETDEMKPRPRNALRELIANFDRWRAMKDATPHGELAQIVLDESGYTEMWQKDRSADAAGRLENLKELVRSMEEFENLAGFLEHISLVMDADKSESGDAVSIMTMHSAKGLEFDTVFLPGWEEGLFPSQRTLDDQGRTGLEEERRLAHVGPHARAPPRENLFRRQPAHARAVVVEHPVALPRRIAGGPCRGAGGQGRLRLRHERLRQRRRLALRRDDAFRLRLLDAGLAARAGARQKLHAARRRLRGGRRVAGLRGLRQHRHRCALGGARSGSRGLRTRPVAQRRRRPLPPCGGGSGRGRARRFSGRDAARRRGPLTIEGELVAKSTGTVSDFSIGDRVFHQKFGNGNVIGVDGNKLTIAFDKAGEKRVVDSFVERV